MKLNISKTKVISISRKTNILIYDYKLCHSSITRTDYKRPMSVYRCSASFPQPYEHYFLSVCKAVRCSPSHNVHLSSLECLLRLYIALDRSKMEYESIVWNPIMSIDVNKLERIQQRFVAFCFNNFFTQYHYCSSFVLEELKLHTLHIRRHSLS
jgi:hypothetical protein